ncbi:MAG TPA: TonB-dependent receptor, partial [Terriglobia bacterium]|nr:TonB-dependent receptor [Terriglobia bacterium]
MLNEVRLMMRSGIVGLAVVLSLAGPGAAQSTAPTGTIQGLVVDSSGAIVAGVRVTAVQESSGNSRTTETDATGHFHFGGLAIGRYSLRAEQQGFSTVLAGPFLLSVGQTIVHPIELKPGEISERLEIKEQPEALDTASTTSSVALGYDRIEEAPAQNRNYLNFVLAAPGVAPSSGSNTQRSAAGIRGVANDSGFTFGGLRGRNNSISIDGVDNRDETTGGNRVAIGLEMVQEFRVSSTTVGAEFGGAAGGLVNMVTRSGTNLWHGDATFFTQNEHLNARNPEAIVGTRPRFRRYQPGVSLNGPIRKDRTFFSAAFEQEWESGEEWSEVPAGFTDAINKTLSQPEFSGSAVKSVEQGLFPANSAQSVFSLKVNHQAGTAHGFSFRYAFSRGRVSQDVQGVDNFADRSSRGSSLTKDHSLVAGWIYVPAPHIVNDLRVQVARRSVDITPNVRGAMYEIPGVLTLGQAYRLDASRTEDHLELVEGFNLTSGKHQLSFGGNAHAVQLNARLANRFSGIFLFPTLQDFFRASPDVFIQAFGHPRTHLSTMPFGFWLQDRWQVRTGLTLEAGLRYDRQQMPTGIPVSSRNLSPRLGMAWHPDGNAAFVVRAGYGLFFDRYPLAFLNDAIQKNGWQGFEQYLVGSSAAEALVLSRGDTLAKPIPQVLPSIYKADFDFPTTYSQKLTGGLERSLGPDTTVSIEASWVRGFHLPRVRNISGTLPANYQLEQTARSRYRGIALTLHRRMSHELSYLLAYNA